jgi:hypothetical protein
MTWSTYIQVIRFQNREWFFLQRVDDYDLLNGDNGVLRDSSGRIGLYTTVSEARAVAETIGEPLREQPPVTTDLDAVLAWSSSPKAETLDHTMVMMAWHTLIDVGAADPFPDAIEPHEPDYALSIVVDKVHDGSAATIEQPRVTARPEWSATELSLLAHTLRAGIRRLADEIIPRGD